MKTDDLKFASTDILVSFLRPFSKYKKYICFIYNVTLKTVSMLTIKTLDRTLWNKTKCNKYDYDM